MTHNLFQQLVFLSTQNWLEAMHYSLRLWHHFGGSKVTTLGMYMSFVFDLKEPVFRVAPLFRKALPFLTNRMTKSPNASLKIFRVLVRQRWKRWHSCDINAPVAPPRWGPRSIMMWYLCFFGKGKNGRVIFWKFGKGGWLVLCKQFCGGDETLCFCACCKHWLWKMVEVYFLKMAAKVLEIGRVIFASH